MTLKDLIEQRHSPAPYPVGYIILFNHIKIFYWFRKGLTKMGWGVGIQFQSSARGDRLIK